MFSYITPAELWNRKTDLVGKKMVRAYWCEDDPKGYLFAFKTLRSVEIGPHAYTMVFEDDTRDELISYDRICVEL